MDVKPLEPKPQEPKVVETFRKRFKAKELALTQYPDAVRPARDGRRRSSQRRERAARAASPCSGAGAGPGWHRGHQ